MTFPGPDYGKFDTYLGGDHAWGGGVDIKYFFHRYFGIGIEGFALDAKRNGFDIRQAFQTFDPFTGDIIDQGIVGGKTTDHRVVGSVLGTLTLRYPIADSRLSPYVWAGGGAIVGGGEKDRLHQNPALVGFEVVYNPMTRHFGSRTEMMGQFGGGLEFRFTPHVGWTNDFSWNVIDGANNNFGMARTGLTFAF